MCTMLYVIKQNIQKKLDFFMLCVKKILAPAGGLGCLALSPLMTQVDPWVTHGDLGRPGVTPE